MSRYELCANPWLNSLRERDAIRAIAQTVQSAPVAIFTPSVVNANRCCPVFPAAYAGSITVQDDGVLLGNTAYSVYKLMHTVIACDGTSTTIGRDDGIVADTYVPVTVMGASAVSLSTPSSAVPFSLIFDRDACAIDVWDYNGLVYHGHPVGYNSHTFVTAVVWYRNMYFPLRQARICYI